MLDLTHHHPTPPPGVAAGTNASTGVNTSAGGAVSTTAMGELGVQDLLLDRPHSPAASARMAYTSEKHPRSTFNELNLIRKRHELCDVVLNVGSRKIFAHK